MLNAKADVNQRAILEGARKLGISVVSLHRVGQGVPDLLLGGSVKCPCCGCAYLMNWLAEIKSPEGKLTERQQKWLDSWRGQAGVVRSLEELLRMVGHG